MASYLLLQPLSSVCFGGKIQFSASRDLSFARSKYFNLKETESPGGVWSIKPPDFSYKLYSSLSVPQKTERRKDANQSIPQSSEAKRITGVYLPDVLRESNKRKEPPKFITSYRPPGALESELMFVRTGKHPSEPYKNPKPHDFRPLDEAIPDIVTTWDRDTGNLNLKLKHLDTLRTTRPESGFHKTKSKLDTHKPAEPKWDAKLLLPQLPWPPKSASYTRHRRRRGAHSAFLDRVEEKLSRSWKNRS